MENRKKIVIYQLFPRLFGNTNANNILWGSLEENGCGKFNDINDNALLALTKLGITHVWLTGIIHHASTTDYSQFGIYPTHPSIVKGRAGSPYAVVNYFDVAPDLAVNVNNRFNEFDDLLNRIHNHNLKVIIDFVPNHVARTYSDKQLSGNKFSLGENDDDSKAFDINNDFYYIPGKKLSLPAQAYDTPPNLLNTLNSFDNYYEYPAKVSGNNCFSEYPSFFDWYDTIKINYGDNSIYSPHSWQCMNEVLCFWANKGVDGFRCDMAEMVPIEYWSWQLNKIKHDYPHVLFIAEIYQRHLYHQFLSAGFDFLYDKVDMYDTLRAVIEGKLSVNSITNSWQNTDGINDYMLKFLENHDEQRIASKFFAGDAQKAIPAFAVAAFMSKSPIMIYNGQEFGEAANYPSGYGGFDGRTSIYDYLSLSCLLRWNNNGNFNDALIHDKEIEIRNQYSDIFHEIATETSVTNGNFYDLMWINKHLADNNCYAFVRTCMQKPYFVIYAINFNNYPIKVSINLDLHFFSFINVSKEADVSFFVDINSYSWKKIVVNS